MPHFIDKVFSPKRQRQGGTKFFLVLAGSGMGKTTAMVSLFEEWHQKKNRHKDLRLYHVADYKTWHYIEQIKNIGKPENTILLLDGFDEDLLAVQDYKRRLEQIIAFTEEFYKVLISSRTQFFPSNDKMLSETKIRNHSGFEKLHHIYVSPFDDADIKTYLNKRFGSHWKFWDKKKKKRAAEIVGKAHTLMVRPMLLAYIDDLLEDERHYQYSHEVYEVMVNKWIEREAKKIAEDRRAQFSQDLYKFSVELAAKLYTTPLEGQYLIHYDDLEPFAQAHGIALSEVEMRSKSLLNRDATGHYRFAHKSILEYFLFIKYLTDLQFAQTFDFDRMSQARHFYRKHSYQLMETAGMDAIASTIEDSLRQDKVGMIGARLAGAHLERVDLLDANLVLANMRGAQLKGALLTGANLEGADLSGADLRGAYLGATILKGADLQGARLEGANLSKANLSKANLQGANLSEANLNEANLRDVNLMGTDLTNAQVQGADVSWTMLEPLQTIQFIAQNIFIPLEKGAAYTYLQNKLSEKTQTTEGSYQLMYLLKQAQEGKRINSQFIEVFPPKLKQWLISEEAKRLHEDILKWIIEEGKQ